MVSIELFGVPGSGKTTVYGHLAARLGAIDDGWKLTPKTGLFRLAWRSPAQIAATMARALRAGPRVATTPAGARLASSIARQRVATAAATRPCVFHEGAVNAAWRLQFVSGCRLPTSWLRSMLPVSDLIVVLDVDTATARERIRAKSRPGPINRDLAAAELDQDPWVAARRAYDSILTALGDGNDVVIVDNFGPAEDAADEVVSRLRAWGD